ncbi:MAG TPA: carbamoyltransferase C-terminal domain-containing protein [Pyrinomonadaceae bacterium]|nr:carbamoyltransferase C-terminal domain-containing protein [Pyrinomonadaceae bacterium]
MHRGADPWILGISASHNGGACLLKGDEIVVAIQEERLSRIKRDRVWAAETTACLAYCLNYAGIMPEDLSMVVLSVAGSATEERNDITRNPLLKLAQNEISSCLVPHHLAHAVSAFATSGFRKSAVLVVDGRGSPFEDLLPAEQAVVRGGLSDGAEIISLYVAAAHSLVPLEKHLVAEGNWLELRQTGMPFFASLGGIFSSVAQQIFGDPAEAGKVMGLAPYGKPTIPSNSFFCIRDKEFHFNDIVPKLFGDDKRWPSRKDEYSNLACSAQGALENALLFLAQRAHTLSGNENLCYAGGVALNSIANERIICESDFQRVFITPAAEDSGAAIGAAYYGLWQLTARNTCRSMEHDACGRLYEPAEITTAIKSATGVDFIESKDVIADAVELLQEGKMLGWFDGRSEMGPRALGQRSIVCDPRRSDAKEILNSRIKKRESFRPFAPVVLLEEVANWFEVDSQDLASPFMLRICRFKNERAAHVPAVVHVDGSGRLQTITQAANGRFYELVKEFYERTGVPMLLNTSFNVQGEPIVETPDDAIQCLLKSGLDACVFEDRIAFKHLRW